MNGVRLTEAQCRSAMAEGEFGPEVIAAARTTVVILTQSWCPQWHLLAGMLRDLPTRPDLAVFQLEYDLEDYFEDFRDFKEKKLGNDLIPYMRYYRGGSLMKTSNYLDRASFLRIIES